MSRRVPTVLVTILVALLVVPLMLIAAAFVTFNTPQGRYMLEVATEWASGGTVRLEGLAGRFPDRLRLRRLAIRDAHGAWLVGDDLTADWSPLELFHGRLHVERLTAARVEMRRSPSYSTRRAHPRQQRETPFELPFTIQLDRGTLPQVDLAAALAGSATALRIDGGGSLRSLRQASLELKAQRLDQTPSAYALSLQSNDQHFQGRLDLQEDANGPLTNLIGLPGLGALSVHLELLGPPTALATTLDARAGPMRAQANGTVDLPSLAATLRLSLEAPAMTPRPGLSWQRVSIQAQSQGPFMAPTTRAQVALEGLNIDDALELESLQATLTGQEKGLALDATASGLRLPGPVQTMFAHAPIRLKGQARMVSANGFDFDLTLAHPLLQAQAHSELGSAGSTPQQPSAEPHRSKKGSPAAAPEQRNGGTLIATIPQLGPWAELAHLNLQGHGSVAASLTVQKEATRITASTDLQLHDGDALWTQLLGSRAETRGRDDDPARANTARARTAEQRLLPRACMATRQGKRLELAWQAALSNLSRLSSGVTGALSARAECRGAAAIERDGGSQQRLCSARSARSAAGTAQAQDLPQQPSSRLQVSGELAGAPLSIIANLHAETADNITLALERLDWKSAHGDATLRVDGDLLSPVRYGGAAGGRSTGFEALLGQPLQGTADAERRV